MNGQFTSEWAEDTLRLVAQKREQTGVGFYDYELRAIDNAGGFADHAEDGLGFDAEFFGLRDQQAVSCRTAAVLERRGLA